MACVCLSQASVAQRAGREVLKLVVGSSSPLLAIVLSIFGGIFAALEGSNYDGGNSAFNVNGFHVSKLTVFNFNPVI